MKKLTLLVILSVFSLFTFADDKDGIEFDHGSWAEITAKAKDAKKLIFIDCYTSWCGPCKRLSAEIFTLKDVGYFFNKNFINYKVDMEKGEGATLAKKFHVGAYPTLLWIDHKGNIVHRALGFKKAENLIAEAQKALDGGNNNTDLEKTYNKNMNNPKIVKAYLNSLIEISDSRAGEVAQQYLSIIPKEQYLDKENFDLIASNVRSPFSFAINYIIEHRAVFDEKFTKQNVDEMLNRKYSKYADSLIRSVKEGKEFDEVNFQKLIALMEQRNFESKDQVIEDTRIKVLQYKKDWKAYVDKINSLIEKGFYKDIAARTYSLWYKPVVESDCKDGKVLESALDWINMAFKKSDGFSMLYYMEVWESKIKVLERMENKADELAKARIELAFIKELEIKQSIYSKEQMKLIQTLKQDNH